MFTKIKSMVSSKRTVKDIHDEFDRAADSALLQAEYIISKGFNDKKKELAAKLVELGFTSTKLVTGSEEEIKIYGHAKERAEIVLKYKEKYPQYKFIFEEQIMAICKKYGLIFGEVWRYKGDIPTKNVEEILDFKVENEDIFLNMTKWSYPVHVCRTDSVISLEEKKMIQCTNSLDHYHFDKPFPLYICAPLKDMKLNSGDIIKNNKIVPDPIVLHKLKVGYLVVSKWGIEGEDEFLKD